VARAIQTLPARCREVFRLKWQLDLPVAEVARQMGIGPKAVERHWTRAIKALRERFTR
jgi:RNA polymerase sigma-70 factor (ECF subfamily)